MFNLDNDEIKGVLVMFVALYFLNKVACTRKSVETFSGDMNLQACVGIMSFYNINIIFVESLRVDQVYIIYFICNSFNILTDTLYQVVSETNYTLHLLLHCTYQYLVMNQVIKINNIILQCLTSGGNARVIRSC